MQEESPGSSNPQSQEKILSAKVWLQRIRQAVPNLLLRRLAVIVLISLAVAGGINMLVSADGFVRQNELEKKKQELEAEIEILKDENRVLRQTLERYQTDPAFVEDEVRKKLGLVRPGETVYRLSEEPNLSDSRRSLPGAGNLSPE